MPDLDLQHLKYLIAVAENGSITRAAEDLLITQPALSRAIRALERTVGVPLFVRSSQSTQLTAAGEALLAEAYELVERSRVALERVRGTETLTVSVPACDLVAVTAVIRTFERENPGLRVNPVVREWVSDPDEVRSGRADVAFMRDCFDRDELVVEELDREPRLVLLPTGHPLLARPRLTVSDLRDEPITHWAEMSPEDAAHWSGADRDRKARRHGPQVGSVVDVMTAIVTGRAVALVHGSTLPGTELPGMSAVPVEGLSPSRLDIGISAHTAKPAAKQFLDHACRGWGPHAG